MGNSNPNIKFNYLYRDAGNNKQFGHVIFSNSNQLQLSEIDKIIKANLIDSEFLDHEEFDVPCLFFPDRNDDLDHGWHEFENVSATNENHSDQRTISAFLQEISGAVSRTTG